MTENIPHFMTSDPEWARLRARSLRLTSAIRVAEKSRDHKLAMRLLKKKQAVA